ncbi:hypothetical protein CC85DRAFT_282060, partial [Cutaneotrichosporon oleaginosum]
MGPDLLTLLESSPDKAIDHYLLKTERSPLSPDSPILKDPAVRLFTATLNNLALKDRPDNPLQSVPTASHRRTTHTAAYPRILGALLARIDCLRVGGNDKSHVGRLLQRFPRISKSFGDAASPFASMYSIDGPKLVEACKNDVDTAQPVIGIEHLTDMDLASNPPKNDNLKPVDNLGPSDTSGKTPPAAQLSNASNVPPDHPQLPTVAPNDTAIIDSIVGPLKLAKRRISLLGNATNPENIKKTRLEATLPRSVHVDVMKYHSPFKNARGLQDSSSNLPEKEWRCDTCGFKTADSSLSSDPSAKSASIVDGPVICSNCEEPRRVSDDASAPTEDRACPECLDILPEGIPERHRRYTTELLKAHLREMHGDYALAIAWRDQQMQRTRDGSTVWTCPSRHCPWIKFHSAKDFEAHILAEHRFANDRDIPIKFLYAIARNEAASVHQTLLENIEKRMYMAEDIANEDLLREVGEFDKLVAQHWVNSTTNKDNKGEHVNDAVNAATQAAGGEAESCTRRASASFELTAACTYHERV